jgi:hypothetical protein
MRLAGIEKGGFYPFPPHMAEATASWFILPAAGTRGRLLDPCSGEGEIAYLLGRLLNCETLRAEPSGRSLGLRALPLPRRKSRGTNGQVPQRRLGELHTHRRVDHAFMAQPAL